MADVDSSGILERENGLTLDLISTLQKSPLSCAYGAPRVAFIKGDKAVIKQGCCNHWNCPRCRFTLAAYHKHRMIEGAKLLMADGPLYFWTTTCRGKDLDLENADENYYLWTNRLLSTCRARAKKQGSRWQYVQVTERQARGAAHSHYIHTFLPSDAEIFTAAKGRRAAHSDWFIRSNVLAGLGPQCTITVVESPVAVAAYISGYLNKQVSIDVWPSKWKRIRYSRGWPDEAEQPDWGTPLIRRSQWEAADRQGVVFDAEDELTFIVAKHHMHNVRRPA